ncbi:transposase (plasmid) [Gluconobacter sphaericus]|uniref:transposase n=1 Tax=Gluconobacter sphaericus TaxID=574987 RepID=UPI001924AC7A|nr:transposase [Gluconobacter sphaericus]QQX92761.1 transposase [Gluconobacter sphaericus]
MAREDLMDQEWAIIGPLLPSERGRWAEQGVWDALMAVPNPKAMLADRGYDSDSFRQDLLIHGILPVILSRKGRNAPQKTDWRRYRDRNRIERMFNRLKQMRRIATRYDKTALSFMSFLNIAAAKFWIGSFINVT